MNELNYLIDVIYEFGSKTAKILYGNPNTLLKLNMKNFDTDTYFIPDSCCEEGQFLLITDKDKELKKELYRFCCEHKDRIFRGEKNERNG